MPTTITNDNPFVLPCADPPAALRFEILDAYDGSLSWVQEPLAHVYVYVAEEQLDSIFVYLGDSIVDYFTPPSSLVLPPAALAAADAQAQQQVHQMCEMIDFMLEPALDSTWQDVPKENRFTMPAMDSVEPKYVWDDATQGGSAERARLLTFAFDPRNKLLVNRFNSETATWEVEDPPLSFTIAVFPADFAVIVTAHRGPHQIAREDIDARDHDTKPDSDRVGLAGLAGEAEARAIVRSCSRAIRRGLLTRPTERTVAAPSSIPALTPVYTTTDN